MNGFQKAIKYIALAFALFLSVTIIAGCALGILKTAVGINILTGGDWFEGGNIVRIDDDGSIKVEIDNEMDKIQVELGKISDELGDDEMFGNVETQSFVKEFTADEAARVRKLNINNYSAKLRVVQGAQLRVEAKDVSMRYVAEIRNGDTLFLGHNGDVEINFFNFNWVNMKKPEVTLTIPAGMEFADADFNIGSGSADLQNLTAEDIFFNTGSGRTEMVSVTAKRELNINSGSGSVHVSKTTAGNTHINSGSGSVNISESGSGNVSINSGSGRVVMSNSNFGDTDVNSGSGSISFDMVNVGDLKLDTGSGRAEFKNGKITGDIEIDSTSGGVSIQADADLNDYNVDCSTGSGGVWINGVKVGDGYKVNNSTAHHELDVDGGSGRVSVELYRK